MLSSRTDINAKEEDILQQRKDILKRIKLDDIPQQWSTFKNNNPQIKTIEITNPFFDETYIKKRIINRFSDEVMELKTEKDIIEYLKKNTESTKEIKQLLIYAQQIFKNKNYNQIKQTLNKYNITEIELSYSILYHFNINIDYDDVLVDLLGYWIEYLNKKNKNNIFYKKLLLQNVGDFILKSEYINTFYIFNNLEQKRIKYIQNPNNPKNMIEEAKKINFFEMFKDKDLYQKIFPKESALEFIKQTKEIGFENIYILTSSITSSIESKEKQVVELFELSPKQIITSKEKGKSANFDYGLLIDDHKDNLSSVVQQNPNGYGALVDMPHNVDYKVGKRIKRINKVIDILDEIPLIASEIINRKLKLKKNIELSMENVFGEKNEIGIKATSKSLEYLKTEINSKSSKETNKNKVNLKPIKI